MADRNPLFDRAAGAAKKFYGLVTQTEVVAAVCIVALGAPQMIGLQSTFDIRFMLSTGFAWRVAAITAASTAPIWLGKLCAHYCAPQVVTKLA